MSIVWTPLRLTMSAEVEEERQRKHVRRFISNETMEQGTQTDIIDDVDAVARNQVNHNNNNNHNNNSRQLYFTSDKETLNRLLSSTDKNESNHSNTSTLPKSSRNNDNEIVVEEIEITAEYKNDLKSKKIGNNEDSIDVMGSDAKKLEEMDEKESCCNECIFFAIDCCGCTII